MRLHLFVVHLCRRPPCTCVSIGLNLLEWGQLLVDKRSGTICSESAVSHAHSDVGNRALEPLLLSAFALLCALSGEHCCMPPIVARDESTQSNHYQNFILVSLCDIMLALLLWVNHQGDFQTFGRDYERWFSNVWKSPCRYHINIPNNWNTWFFKCFYIRDKARNTILFTRYLIFSHRLPEHLIKFIIV